MLAAVMALLAMLAAAMGAVLLAGEDDLLGEGVELGDLLIGKGGENVVGGLRLNGAALLGELLAASVSLTA